MPSIEEIEVKLEVMNSGEIMNRFAKTIIKKVMEKQLKKSDCCTIRQASVEDAPMIAEAIIMAVGEDTVKRFCRGDYRAMFEEMARMELSQYSYRNALVAEVDGVAVGAIVGYDGARLHELREPVFEIMCKYNGERPVIAEETGPGEFYLDSMGVLPQFRGRGIGGSLLAALRDKAIAEGHECTGLLVDFDNPGAERLYHSLGFRRVEVKDFLGHKMWHMQYRSNPKI